MRNLIPDTIATIRAWFNDGLLTKDILNKDIVNCLERNITIDNIDGVVILTKRIPKRYLVNNLYENEIVVSKDKGKLKIILSPLDVTTTRRINFTPNQKEFTSMRTNVFMSRNRHINEAIVVGMYDILVKKVIERKG